MVGHYLQYTAALVEMIGSLLHYSRLDVDYISLVRRRSRSSQCIPADQGRNHDCRAQHHKIFKDEVVRDLALVPLGGFIFEDEVVRDLALVPLGGFHAQL